MGARGRADGAVGKNWLSPERSFSALRHVVADESQLLQHLLWHKLGGGDWFSAGRTCAPGRGQWLQHDPESAVKPADQETPAGAHSFYREGAHHATRGCQGSTGASGDRKQVGGLVKIMSKSLDRAEGKTQ